jgi:hypothetical protein
MILPGRGGMGGKVSSKRRKGRGREGKVSSKRRKGRGTEGQ